MVNQKAKESSREESKLEMTPMIDVTFLLLIFFLCSIKFKVLEGKIPAYLPKDVGVNTTPIDKELEKIDIEIYRLVPAPTMEQLRQMRIEGKDWAWDEDQIKLTVNGTVMKGIEDFYLEVKRLHELLPELKATLYPMTTGGRAIIYADAVKVVNECLRARLTDITFGGTPMDS